MRIPSVGPALHLLSRECERLILLVMALVLGLTLCHGYGRLQALLAPPLAGKARDPVIVDPFHPTAWRFLEPAAAPVLPSRHAYATSYPPEWLRPVTIAVARASVPLPPPDRGELASTEQPAWQPGLNVENNTLHPAAGNVADPAAPPAVAQPNTPQPRAALVYHGFIRSTTNRQMACVSQRGDAAPGERFLEVGSRIAGLTVVAAERDRLVLRRPNGDLVTLPQGESLAVPPSRPAPGERASVLAP